MKAPSRIIAASEFKAKCLGILDEVAASGGNVTITKHGKALARLVPVEKPARGPLFGGWRSTIRIRGDIVSPISEAWDADK